MSSSCRYFKRNFSFFNFSFRELQDFYLIVTGKKNISVLLSFLSFCNFYQRHSTHSTVTRSMIMNLRVHGTSIVGVIGLTMGPFSTSLRCFHLFTTKGKKSEDNKKDYLNFHYKCPSANTDVQ